jgi:hypothetical protein
MSLKLCLLCNKEPITENRNGIAVIYCECGASMCCGDSYEDAEEAWNNYQREENRTSMENNIYFRNYHINLSVGDKNAC